MLTQVVLEKRPLNGCSSSGSSSFHLLKKTSLWRLLLPSQQSIGIPLLNDPDPHLCKLFDAGATTALQSLI